MRAERLASADVFKLPVLGVAVPYAMENVLLTVLEGAVVFESDSPNGAAMLPVN